MRTTKKLYQWDTDQKLINCVGKYVDYPIGDGVYRIDVIDKECIIPDELLQVSGTVKVYECMEYGTVKAFAFYINPRPKPPDYVFTPTERLTFEGLVKKVDETIEDLQKRAASGEFDGSDYVITESDYDAIAAKTADKLQPTIGELARTLETEKTDREQADKGKLTEPVEGLAVGKYFRVAQIDENGHAVLEAVDAKTIGVQDVKVNGGSIVNGENGVADLPIAGVNQPGLVGLDSRFGITCVDGKAYPATRDANEYKNSSVYLYVSKGTLDSVLANPSIMPALTSDEQAAARERIGADGVASGSLSYHQTRIIQLGDNLINDNTIITLGNGWSGNINDGFTHSRGSTEPLTFDIGAIQNDKYLIDFIGSSSGNGCVGVQMGDEPVVDVYNGTTHMYVGFISNSGIVKIVPTNQSLSITLTDVKIRKVVSGGTPFSYDCKNVNHGQDEDDITGFWNVAIGSDSTLAKNQNGSRNVAIGNESLRELKVGTRNIAIGTFSMPFVQEGERNIAIGADTIYDTDGVKSRKATDNIAIGKATLKSGTNITDNIAIGSGAMSGNTETASKNVCIGRQSGAYASNNNTHIGYQAGYYTKGNGNTSVGYQAGRDNYNTGDNNTCVGYKAGILDKSSSPSDIKTISEAIAIGANTKAEKTGQMVLGSSAITEVVFCGNKKINFNADGTVTWETI